MATQKPVEWVSSLIIRFEEQLPYRTGPQTSHARQMVEQNKECLIQISKYKFSLVISGLTKILQRVNESCVLIAFENREHMGQTMKRIITSLCLLFWIP